LLDAIFGHTTIDNVIVTPRPENEAAQRLYRRFCFRPSLPPPGFDPGECEYWTLERANTRSPSTLIFDWGGVLMRTMDDDGRRAWEARLGLPAGGASQVVFGSTAWRDAQLGRCTAEQCWSVIGDSLELTPVALTQFRRDFWAGDQLNQPLIERIREWKAAGNRVALLSNYPAALDRLLCEHGLRGLFEPAVISAHKGVMKPASRIFWRTLNGMRISPADALLVDDAEENVAGARNVGLHAIQFHTTRQTIKEIEDLLP
jgi:putative hydrolase of the HAD superfamily